MFLKPFFSSKTRIKILTLFFTNTDKSFFVREITRHTNEQINSIRRELEHLEETGLFTHYTENGKKYFLLNPNFFLFAELKRIFEKITSPALQISADLSEKGVIDLIILTGQFINDQSVPIDLFVVGDVSKQDISEYMQNDLSSAFEIRFAVISHAEFIKRLRLEDRILRQLLSNQRNIVPINTQKENIEKYL